MEAPTPPPPQPAAVEDVIRFLSAHGFARAAAALRDDLLAREKPSLPPVRLAPSRPGTGGEGGVIPDRRPSSSSSSHSSDDFVSIGSSPSELLNPYGIWSPERAKSEDSSSDRDFGTAREYNNSNVFNDISWYNDQYGGYLNDPHPLKMNYSGRHSEDKFVMSIEAEKRLRKQESFYFDAGDKPEQGERLRKQESFHFDAGDEHEHGTDEHCEGCSEIYSCSVPLCDCCRGSRKDNGGGVPKRIRDSNSAIYGRYQILDDHTERLDECGDDGFQLKRVDEHPDAVFLEGDSLSAVSRVKEKKSLELGIVEKDFQMINLSSVDGNAGTGCDPMRDKVSNGNLNDSTKVAFVNTMDNDGLQKEEYNIQPFPHRSFEQDADDVFELGECRQAEGENQVSGAVGVEEDNAIDELQLYTFEDEYEIFDLRIIHRKNRTGFEENKDLPIVLNSIIAGRYYVTEYLGSAAFSKVVQAHDLQTGMDVCLKIIKNDKDFFDQSLDEIKLLKFVNKHDPADEHHVLRLYDYFYHQEHLFIVTELLRANLYEFQKYNTESGGEVYFTLSRIQTIARQCLQALEYLHRLRIIHCDLKPENILIKSYSRCEIKVIDLGSSCFQTDHLSLYVQSRSYRAPEVILGLPYDQRIDLWSLGCILAELYTGDVLFPNESVVMMLARMIGILGPIDMEMLAMGQEMHKYFTDNYDLYHRNEETDQIEYLIPEKSSLAHHLQTADSKFIDFLTYLLQINPRGRPTASQALKHQFLSFPYH